MATGQEALAYLGLTVEQVNQFIQENIGQHKIIYDAAYDVGITTQHLSDITGYSTDTIKNFFATFELDTRLLDEVKILFNSDLGDLANLVGFNDHSGVLSTASLGDQVKLDTDSSDYSAFYEPVFSYQQADGIYTPDELGVSHLGNVPATDESIESLVYGTLINIYSALDETELSQLKGFSHNESNVNEYRSLLTDALSDPANRSDQDLADLIAAETGILIDEYWNNMDVTGILDHSILGLSGIA